MKRFLHIISFLFLITNYTFSINYHLQSGGNPTNLNHWWTNSITSGSGTNPPNFNTVGDKFYLNQFNPTVTLSATWSLGSPLNSQVYVGRASGSSAGRKFIIAAGGDIVQANLNLNTSAILEVKIPAISITSVLNISNGDLIFSGVGPQVLPNTSSVRNLTVSTTSGSASMANDFTVINNLNITTKLQLSGYKLSLNNRITGSGTITGDINSIIEIAPVSIGTNVGTIKFEPGSEFLNQFSIYNDATITLGSNLTINGSGTTSYFDQTGGTINLSGNSLTLGDDCEAHFSSALPNVISGDINSSVFINAPILDGSLMMDATNNNLKVLSVNSPNPFSIGTSLNIFDSLDINQSIFDATNLKLKSSNVLKGRIAEIKGGGSVTGNIEVETFIPGGSAGWANLGPSGVSGLFVSNWDGGSGSATAFAMTCVGCTYNETSAGGYFVSIQGDPTGTGVYTELTASTPLMPGVGYWAFVGSDLTSAIDITQTTSGSVVTGNLTSGTGFMSNPYPSPISIDRIKSHNAGLTSIDVYNANTGAYVSFNGGLPTAAVIPMGQGFYANGVSTINFSENDKVAYNTSAFGLLKTASTSSIGNVFQLHVKSATGSLDKAYIRFHGSATNGFDNNLDAYKRYVTPGYLGYPGPYSKYTTIATVNSSNDYAINSIPYALTSNAVIPVKVKVEATGQYTISPVDISSIAPGACVTLKDKLLGVTHDLRTGNYICTISDTTTVARFELIICADIAAGINEQVAVSSNIFINQDINGAYVNTKFENNTKATISAYNMMGQKIMDDKEIEGKQTTTYLNLGNIQSQVVVIKVTTAKESSVKKIFIN